MSLISNERTKLTAAWLNAISAASGGIAQVMPLFTGTSTTIANVAVFSAFWLAVGIALHERTVVAWKAPAMSTLTLLIGPAMVGSAVIVTLLLIQWLERPTR